MIQKLNKLDRGILDVLIGGAKTPYAKIAAKFGISNGTVHVRIKKLERMGVITGSMLRVDYNKLGFLIKGFVGINLDNGTSNKAVMTKLEKVLEVTDAYFATGKHGIFAETRCKDPLHMKEVLTKIQKIKGVSSTDSFIALDAGIERGGLVS